MLYVFLVGTGKMMTFDMSLALETTSILKSHICRMCGIPEEKQVLLISGGELLDVNVKVSNYSAGTDTNPIFLFCKASLESGVAPSPSVDLSAGTEQELQEKVEGCLNLSPSLTTVAARAQLAQHFLDLAKNEQKCCSRLVHEQHLQQQGFSAVVANLEDVAKAFLAQKEQFVTAFKRFLESREEKMKILSNFEDDLQRLEKIHIVPSLLKLHNISDSSQKTLLDWVRVSKEDMVQLAAQCQDTLNRLNEDILEDIGEGANSIVNAIRVEGTDYKELKGIEERLSMLENLMCQAIEIVKQQSELAKAFQANQNRATHLNDPSILPDLCESHRNQLQVMLENHSSLINLRQRISKGKVELCNGIYGRLQWIMHVEQAMTEINSKFYIYNESIKRMNRQLEEVRQLRTAPPLYLQCLKEVLRRRKYSQAFTTWASGLSESSCALHSDEIKKRQKFNPLLENHFLVRLFVGMKDTPPAFATKVPRTFDVSLPEVTNAEIEQVCCEIGIPEEGLGPQDVVTWPYLQLQTKALSEEDNAEMKCREEKDAESETDTEEFEKVGRVVGETAQGVKRAICDASAQTDEVQMKVDVPQGDEMQDFDMDEVMASSCTESSEVSSAELQRQLQQRNAQITKLQDDYENLCKTVNVGMEEVKKMHSGLKEVTVAQMRDYLHAQKLASQHLLVALQQVDEHMTSEKNEAMTLALEDAKAQMEEADRQWKEVRDLLELEKAKHADTYHQLHLEQNHVARMHLEHELDVEKLRESMEQEVEGMREQISVLRKERDSMPEQIAARVEQQVHLMRSDSEARYQQEQEHLYGKWQEQHMKEIEEQRFTLSQEQEAALKALREELAKEHKSELESLRARFRLMSQASLERPASESSDSGSPRSDGEYMIRMVQSLQEALEKAKQDQAIMLKTEQEQWQKVLQEKLQEDTSEKKRKEAERQTMFNEALTKLREDKQKVINELKKELRYMSSQNQELRNCLAIASTEGAQAVSDQACVSPVEMNRSFAVCKGPDAPDLTASTSVPSPETQRRQLQERSNRIDRLTQLMKDNQVPDYICALMRDRTISTSRCKNGEKVLLLWDPNFNSYVVYDETAKICFLNRDSCRDLNLSIEKPESLFATAQIAHKEFCRTRKMENRFGLPKDTTFYRIECNPWTPAVPE